MAQAEFGETFSIGGQSAVANFLHGRSPLSLKAAIGFARGLSTPIDSFSPRLAAEAREISEASRVDFSAAIRYEQTLPRPVSPPMLGTLSWDPEKVSVVYTHRPTGEHVAFWSTVDDIYAVRLVGDMFHPRYRAGEVLILGMKSAPVPGVDTLITMYDVPSTKYLRQWSAPSGGSVSTLPLDGQGRPLTLNLDDIQETVRVVGCVAPDLVREIKTPPGVD